MYLSFAPGLGLYSVVSSLSRGSATRDGVHQWLRKTSVGGWGVVLSTVSLCHLVTALEMLPKITIHIKRAQGHDSSPL